MRRVPLIGLLVLLGLGAWPADGAECNKSFSTIFREIEPSVVRLFTVAIDPFSLKERVKLSIGSGLVIDDDFHIVTNAHIIYGTREILVSTNDGNMHRAAVVGLDAISDLAVIRLEEPVPGLRKAEQRAVDGFEIGEEVLAVGYPFGLGMTATRGIVSGVERVLPISPTSWLTPLVQTDAAINPGNSGGPLVDRCGKVLAINTLAGEKGQNINFAIPIHIVRELVPELVAQGRIIRAWHGIYGKLVPPPLMFTLGIAPGLLVETIEPGSPAETIGLRGGNFPIVIGVHEYLIGGDVIVEVNGTRLMDMDTVIRIVRSLKVGDKVSLRYWRNGQLNEAEIVLPERPLLPGDVRRFQENRHPR